MYIISITALTVNPSPKKQKLSFSEDVADSLLESFVLSQDNISQNSL